MKQKLKAKWEKLGEWKRILLKILLVISFPFLAFPLDHLLRPAGNLVLSTFHDQKIASFNDVLKLVRSKVKPTTTLHPTTATEQTNQQNIQQTTSQAEIIWREVVIEDPIQHTRHQGTLNLNGGETIKTVVKRLGGVRHHYYLSKKYQNSPVSNLIINNKIVLSEKFFPKKNNNVKKYPAKRIYKKRKPRYH